MSSKKDQKVALYCRVSTENQELEAQEKKLKDWAERMRYDYDIYSEKVSSIKERPKFEEIMEKLDEYDKLVVTNIDRFARSVRDFVQRYEDLKEHDTEFQAIDQPIDTDDELYGDFMLKQLSLFAELERKMIRKRLKEGWKKAYKQGRVGRPSKINDEAGEVLKEMYRQDSSYDYMIYVLRRDFDIDTSKTTVYNYLKEEGVIDE